MWICRKIFTTIAAGIWITIAFRYEDINRCNHKLLKEIKRELEKIKSNGEYKISSSCQLQPLIFGTHFSIL